jgi:serine/threonine protein kinase
MSEARIMSANVATRDWGSGAALAERIRSMPLEDGARLGPYEIIDAIGAGSMGKVYRARDPRLGRFVAIKVLASQNAAEHQAAARFEDEARAVA